MAIYTHNDGVPQCDKSAIEPKRCTQTGEYIEGQALFGDRKDEDWNKALAIADELLEKYVKDRQKLRELLRRERVWEDCKHGTWLSPCPLCKEEKSSNDLISGEEISALRAQARTLTMQDALRATMEGKFVLIVPMCLKSGFCASLSVIESSPDHPLELLSIAKCSKSKSGYKLPDPADADHIASAVLGKGYNPIVGLLSKQMLHYWKRRG